ncbi:MULTISPECIES: hypothetical protein [Pseudoalteromonas]|uniref:Uncharacterized protein n=1 Tax=Pseudoalteromonas lipolytica TaxID=570156 RepID=A0AAD0RWK6_9GAMM|nr:MULTISPECIES: hypothetical protein [Pseudoalteromonas]AXV63856.1 hypothetical protein D0907_00460 [Pseudoalteromonas donghaensis]EWH04067.1 hypothetical protein AT00_21225 [Pseudoalteromonas lipolytica SCSIO 04301]MBE0352490.1 hypothetical protein [Pseudoalteromonas lipolytica LMEB 39]MCC9662284.1 hypothetical protein [Pseudoalteromonas sp. MB41]QLJ08348.1 hypothetical protein GZH31_00245 [Pseudoalteromonas sp. JSTW]
MDIILIAYLVIFALFGTAASYFVRYIYAYWVHNTMHVHYIYKAGVCIISVVIVSGLMTLFT